MAYTTIDKPSDYFDTKLYTGTGSNNITLTMDNVGWVWMKNRTNSGNHILMDIVRGGNNSNSQKPVLVSNITGAEQGSDITATGGVAFGSTSTVIGSDNGGYNYNNSTSSNYVAWHWGTGTSFTNDASSTGIGSIDSTGSVSTDAGFSIISYTGTGSAATVAHGLGSTPKMIIVKNRSSSQHWQVYHISTGNTKSSQLSGGGGADTASTYWNNTSPTSTVFSIGTGTPTNGNGNAIIAYCFSERKGFSKFGSYTGNGSASSGTFIYTGFKPAFVMIKRTDTTSSWEMYDAKREGFNPQVHALYANGNNAEDNTDDLLDLLSNGFKLYHDGGGLNASGSSYIFMAFAENPFVSSTGVPATAR